MRQDLVLLSMLAGLAAVVLPMLLVFFLALGPLGWLLTGVSIVVAGVAVAAWADDESSDDGPSKTNCAECGSRVVAGDDCDYCGASLDG